MDRHGRSDDAFPGDPSRPAAFAEPPVPAAVPSGEGAVVRQWVDALEGVVEDARDRAGGELVSSSAGRRWPWSVGAAVAGAAAGAALVLLVRRVVGQDAPDAQEPEQLQAVVDTGLPPGSSPQAP